MELSLKDGEFLVKLARRAVTTYLDEGRKISPPADTPPHLREKRGVFVTIEKLVAGARELRGCIGFPEPLFPLVEATIDSALHAAFEDPRFPPLRSDELTEVVFEVSVLTVPKPLQVSSPREYPERIKVGRDGLIVEYGYIKGLLLPQVPLEYGWDAETFLSHCCMKAGLPPDFWLTHDIKVYTFQAQVFTEKVPNGPVEERKEILLH
ncbi:MAG TPA: TIGR00296 family protein [Candidatus Methanomethylia archaeon]|nr:TIGR00296 family protein [Candidatus Methanomethylicia archaeon]